MSGAQVEQPGVYKYSGLVRTVMDCHNCSKQFVAELDYDLNGQHVVECPHCGHLHYRKIKDGVVTSERYDSDVSRDRTYRDIRVWKADSRQLQTAAASEFIRRKWLNSLG